MRIRTPSIILINCIYIFISLLFEEVTKVHLHSVDPQKNHRNCLITLSIKKFPILRRSLI